MYYFVPISPAKHPTISVQRVGDKTPADLLIFSANDLKVDNSSLTGESEAQERGPNHKGSGNRPVEAENLVSPIFLVRPCDSTGDHRLLIRLLSLTVKHGEVRIEKLLCWYDMCSTDLLVVVRTGDKTLIGRLPSLTTGPFTERLLYSSDRAAHWRRVRKQVSAWSRNVRFYHIPRIGSRWVEADQKHFEKLAPTL